MFFLVTRLSRPVRFCIVSLLPVVNDAGLGGGGEGGSGVG